MSDIKSFPFPVLSLDRIDYEGCEYAPDVQSRVQGHDEIKIHHVFRGDGLIGEMLDEGNAVFGCMISLPSTMYRGIYVVSESGKRECVQTINYGDSGYGQETDAVEAPMFRPVIIACRRVHKKVSESDRLDPLWADSLIDIPDGSIIAYGEWMRFNSGMGGLLMIELGKNLRKGEMHVEADASGGFRFRVKLAKDVFHHVKDPSNEDIARQRRAVLTSALSAAFFYLMRDHSNPKEWDEHINLRAVADLLKQEGLDDWADDDFHPEFAASVMYPYAFPESDAEEESV